jgi:hypothetical protein
MDERSRLLALLKACHEVIEQLEKLPAKEDNPFAKRIRDTCRALQDRLRKLDGRRGPWDGRAQP